MSTIVSTVEPAIGGAFVAGSPLYQATLCIVAIVVGASLILLQEWDD